MMCEGSTGWERRGKVKRAQRVCDDTEQVEKLACFQVFSVSEFRIFVKRSHSLCLYPCWQDTVKFQREVAGQDSVFCFLLLV